jgi:hypothetical protein
MLLWYTCEGSGLGSAGTAAIRGGDCRATSSLVLNSEQNRLFPQKEACVVGSYLVPERIAFVGLALPLERGSRGEFQPGAT